MINSIKEGLIKADMLVQSGQYDAALEVYDLLIEKQKDCIPAYNNKALIYEKIGEYEKALECYHKVLEYRPQVLIPLRNLAHLYMKMEDWENAEDTFRKVIAIPYSDEAFDYANFAHVLSHNGKYEEAIENLKIALKIDPSATIYNNLAYTYELIEDYDKALEYYDEAIRMESDGASLYNNRSWPLKKLGRFDEAILDLEKAIELDSGNARYLKNMAILYKELGEIEKAHEFYDRAFELDGRIESFEEIKN